MFEKYGETRLNIISYSDFNRGPCAVISPDSKIAKETDCKVLFGLNHENDVDCKVFRAKDIYENGFYSSVEAFMQAIRQEPISLVVDMAILETQDNLGVFGWLEMKKMFHRLRHINITQVVVYGEIENLKKAAQLFLEI